MLWIAGGLFVLGIACGAAIRLMVFIGVLLSAAVIAIAVVAMQGIGKALLVALVAVVALQVGYAVGLASRAASRSLFRPASGSAPDKPPMTARFDAKRR